MKPADATRATSEQLSTAAVQYVSRGWRVFPLHSVRSDGTCTCRHRTCGNIAKHPRTRNGNKDASGREAVIRAWWDKWADANIGIRTGAISGIVVLDIDQDKGGYDSLAMLERKFGALPTTLTARTGGGGEHRFFAHPGGDTLIRNATCLTGLDGLDVRGDGGYVVGAPSRHASGNDYTWVNADEDIAPLPEWLLDLMQRAMPEADETPRTLPVREDRGTDAQHWLDYYATRASEGNRNETGKLLALQLRDTSGLTEQEAESYMLDYAQRVPGNDYTAREALATLRSIYKQAPREPARSAGPNIYAPPAYPPFYPAYLDASTGWPAVDVASTSIPTRDRIQPDTRDTGKGAYGAAPVAPQATPESQPRTSRFHLLTDVEVEALPKPEWMIGGILPTQTLSVVYGEYGSGKSFVILDWLLSVVTGRAWCGHPVKQGSAVYVAGEGLRGIGKRIRAWKQHQHWQGETGLHVLGTAPQLLRHEDVAQFAATLDGIPDLRLIVLDTLARCLVGGDENSQKDMGIAVAAADYLRERFGAHVLIVHHKPNNNGTGNGRTRGSSSLPGGADTLIDVSKDGNLITLRCPKQKDDDPFTPMHLMLQSVSLDEYGQESSCVLVPHQRLDRNDAPAVMLAVLQDTALTYAEWERACGQRGVPPSTFKYHLNRMKTDDQIELEHGRYKLALS